MRMSSQVDDAAPAPANDGAPDAEPELDPEAKSNPASEAFHRIRDDLGELKEYAQYYLAARVDSIRQTIRRLGLYAALGVLGLIAGGAIVATAAGLLVIGFAEILTRLFGGRDWLGDLVAGVVVLSIVAAGALFMMKKLTGTWRTLTIQKYEQRKQSQREQFDGRDVHHRAREAAANAAQQQDQRS
jgi:hypothetical protein